MLNNNGINENNKFKIFRKEEREQIKGRFTLVENTVSMLKAEIKSIEEFLKN